MAISQITSNSIAAGAVSASDLADGSITTAKIADTAVTNAKIDTVAATKLTGTIAAARLPAGSVIQVVQIQTQDVASYTGTSWQTISYFTQSITPSSTSNKVLIRYDISWSGSNDSYSGFRILRNGTEIATPSTTSPGTAVSFSAMPYSGGSPEYRTNVVTFSWLDSPSTTSAVSYTLQVSPMRTTSREFKLNQAITYGDANQLKCYSTATFMEIAG